MSFIKSTITNATKQKSVMRIVNASLALLFVTSLTLNLANSNSSAEAASYYTCKSPNTGKVINLSSDKFQPASIAISGDKAVATFKFPGECSGQSIPISFVSYKAPNTPDNQPYSKQVLFDSVTRNYNDPRNGAQITINVPSCKFQVDLVVGYPIAHFSDGPGSANTYHGQNRMITASGGGSGECFPAAPAPAPAPAPAAPVTIISACNNNSCNTTTIEQTNNNNTEINNSPGANVNTQQGNAASVANGGNSQAKVDQEMKVVNKNNTHNKTKKVVVKQKVESSSNGEQTSSTVSYGKGDSPKELPNTGAGAIAPILFGTSFMSSFLYTARSRYSELLAKLIARF